MADEVVQRQLLVVNPMGMHARPAALVAKLAIQFRSEIVLVKGNQRVDAKGVIDLMTLSAEQGSNLLLEARGIDAQSAVDAIEKLFQNGLGDLDAQPNTPEP